MAGNEWFTFEGGMKKLPLHLEELKKHSAHGNIEHQKGIDMQKVLEWACGWVEPIETVHLCLRLRGGGSTKDKK